MAFGMIFARQCRADEQKLYKAGGKRDPFVQLVAVGTGRSASGLLGVESLEEIQIEGIVMDQDPKASVVVVNGSVLRASKMRFAAIQKGPTIRRILIGRFFMIRFLNLIDIGESDSP